MKIKPIILSLILISGCNTTNPFIVPDNTKENAVMLQLKNQITNPGAIKPSYGWLFWYAPIAIISLMAAWRYLIKKPSECLEDEDTDGYDDDGKINPKKENKEEKQP